MAHYVFTAHSRLMNNLHCYSAELTWRRQWILKAASDSWATQRLLLSLLVGALLSRCFDRPWQGAGQQLYLAAFPGLQASLSELGKTSTVAAQLVAENLHPLRPVPVLEQPAGREPRT